MSYSEKTDILERVDEATLIQLTDDAGTGSVDDAKVTRAIASADATIDAKCRGRYSVPFSPVPERVRDLSVDIALYNLFTRKIDAPDRVQNRFSDAIKFLDRVADGKDRFDDEPPAPANTRDTVSISSKTRVFDREKMSGF